jgi:hypothetical protein
MWIGFRRLACRVVFLSSPADRFIWFVRNCETCQKPTRWFGSATASQLRTINVNQQIGRMLPLKTYFCRDQDRVSTILD